MADQTLPEHESKKNLTADVYAAFSETLNILYIPGNIGARLNFLKKWPAAAANVFGEELIAYDTEGAGDKERKAELEQEAEERRIALLEIVKSLEAKSVDKGILQTDYVETIIKSLGRDLSLLLYAPRIVDRFLPPPAPPIPEQKSELNVQIPEDAAEITSIKGPMTYEELLAALEKHK